MTKFSHVLITGASSGIGEALAIHYAKLGTKHLSICGRNKERLDKNVFRSLPKYSNCEVLVMLGENILKVLPRAHGCKQQKAVLLI